MYIDRPTARNVVVEFLDCGYGNSFWDDMIATPPQGLLGCVLKYIDSSILSQSRWPEVGFHVGRLLRNKYPNGKARWNAQNWPAEVDPVHDLIDDDVMRCAALPLPQYLVVEPPYTPTIEPQTSGFVPWRLFRKRTPVPHLGGVYVFAYFDGSPEQVVDVISKQVIYIGYTGHDKNRRTLDQRLTEFEETALGLLGHSGGWTYRTEFVADWESLKLFRNT